MQAKLFYTYKIIKLKKNTFSLLFKLFMLGYDGLAKILPRSGTVQPLCTAPKLNLTTQRAILFISV